MHEIFYNFQFKKYNCNSTHSYNRKIWVDIPSYIIFTCCNKVVVRRCDNVRDWTLILDLATTLWQRQARRCHNVFRTFLSLPASIQCKGWVLKFIDSIKYDSEMLMMMIKMTMNCFCGMVDRRKAFSLISSGDHCQRSSTSRISDTPRAGFEPAQNLSSDLVE